MGLRVALITRRYWPMVGGAETMMSNLAQEFRRQGAEPTIVTGQWRADWPVKMHHLGSPVVRLPSPKPASWGVIRYLISLSRWLRRNHEQFDAICVSRLQYDGYAAVTSLEGRGVPVVLRAEHSGETGDCKWLEKARFGNRIRRALHGADALIAPTQLVADETAAAGFDVQRTQLIPNGVPIVAPRTAHTRLNARRALAGANGDLNSPPASPVILAVDDFHASRRLADLVRAFRVVVQQDPNSLLWLIGDGPERDRLFRQIVDAGLHHQVFMPGVFDDLDDLMHAADIFVCPTDQEARTAPTLQAMSYGLPVVATDLAGNRDLIQSGVQGFLTPPRETNAMAAAIAQLAAQQADRARMGAAARESVSRFDVQRCAAEHLQLLERCIADRSATAK